MPALPYNTCGYNTSSCTVRPKDDTAARVPRTHLRMELRLETQDANLEWIPLLVKQEFHPKSIEAITLR